MQKQVTASGILNLFIVHDKKKPCSVSLKDSSCAIETSFEGEEERDCEGSFDHLIFRR